MNTAVHQQIWISFARAGARGFFQPGFFGLLDIGGDDHRSLSAADEYEFARRPNSYLYIGAAIELCVATAIFIFMVGVGLLVRSLMLDIVSRYGNHDKWNGAIDLVSGGINFIALGLLLVFGLKVISTLLTKTLKI